MKKLNEKMIKRYGEIYKRMYDNEEDTFEKSHLFDEKFEVDIDFKDLVNQYNKVTKRFIDGTKQHELLFAIDMITQYDNQGTSDINMQAMGEVNKFTEWLDTLSVDNYPDFGDNNTILKIEVLTNVPNLLIDSTQQLAKYQFQTKITYNEERSL